MLASALPFYMKQQIAHPLTDSNFNLFLHLPGLSHYGLETLKLILVNLNSMIQFKIIFMFFSSPKLAKWNWIVWLNSNCFFFVLPKNILRASTVMIFFVLMEVHSMRKLKVSNCATILMTFYSIMIMWCDGKESQRSEREEAKKWPWMGLYCCVWDEWSKSSSHSLNFSHKKKSLAYNSREGRHISSEIIRKSTIKVLNWQLKLAIKLLDLSRVCILDLQWDVPTPTSRSSHETM